jgi:hypothetical protein
VPRTKTKTLINKADALFTTLIHKRGKCQRCGSMKALQTAHILSRINKNLRWNEDNALLLCATCHFWAHQNPILFSEFVRTDFPIQYAFLMREANTKNYNAGTTLEYTIKELKERTLEEEKI